MKITLRVLVLVLALASSLAGLQGSFGGPGQVPLPCQDGNPCPGLQNTFMGPGQVPPPNGGQVPGQASI